VTAGRRRSRRQPAIPATERANPRSAGVDRLGALEIVELINDEDARVPGAVRAVRRPIAAAVELIAGRFRAGGRLLYVGAGTSGRLGVLDAAECPPTFGSRPGRVQGIIAGGRRALVRAVEGAEDSASDGAEAVDGRGVGPDDVVVGIAACGLTPFVRGAMRRARQRGAAVVFVTCSPESVCDVDADVIINPEVGPEVVTGSTRMKAGTATKLILNTLTTGAMVRTGKVYGNLMVDLTATNAKLRDRSERIVRELTGLDRRAARRLLDRAGGRVKVALVMHIRRVDARRARRLLKEAGGFLRDVIG